MLKAQGSKHSVTACRPASSSRAAAHLEADGVCDVLGELVEGAVVAVLGGRGRLEGIGQFGLRRRLGLRALVLVLVLACGRRGGVSVTTYVVSKCALLGFTRAVGNHNVGFYCAHTVNQAKRTTGARLRRPCHQNPCKGQAHSMNAKTIRTSNVRGNQLPRPCLLQILFKIRQTESDKAQKRQEYMTAQTRAAPTCDALALELLLHFAQRAARHAGDGELWRVGGAEGVLGVSLRRLPCGVAHRVRDVRVLACRGWKNAIGVKMPDVKIVCRRRVRVRRLMQGMPCARLQGRARARALRRRHVYTVCMKLGVIK